MGKMGKQNYSDELIQFLSTAYEMSPLIRSIIIDQTPDKNNINEALFNCLFTDFLTSTNNLKNVDEKPEKAPEYIEQFLALAVMKQYPPPLSHWNIKVKS